MKYNPAFLLSCKLVHFAGTTAGATNITYTTIDLGSGGEFDTVTMIVLLGTVVDAGTLRLRAYTADDGSNTNPELIDDVVGSEAQTSTVTTSSSSNKIMWLTVVRPKKRYVTFVLERATQNTTVLGAVAILSGPRDEPITQPAAVLAYAVGLQN